MAAELDLEALRVLNNQERDVADDQVFWLLNRLPAIIAALERGGRIEAKIKQRQASLATASEDPTAAAIRAVRLDELGIIELAGLGEDAPF